MAYGLNIWDKFLHNWLVTIISTLGIGAVIGLFWSMILLAPKVVIGLLAFVVVTAGIAYAVTVMQRRKEE